MFIKLTQTFKDRGEDVERTIRVMVSKIIVYAVFDDCTSLWCVGDEAEDPWRVKETPEEIDSLLSGADVARDIYYQLVELGQVLGSTRGA